jgi:hypothetical protein
VTPERLASLSNAFAHGDGPVAELLAEVKRQSVALFADAQCDDDSHWDEGVSPVDADALVLGATDEEGWDWCCLDHLPANLPPERVIWRLTA